MTQIKTEMYNSVTNVSCANSGVFFTLTSTESVESSEVTLMCEKHSQAYNHIAEKIVLPVIVLINVHLRFHSLQEDSLRDSKDYNYRNISHL